MTGQAIAHIVIVTSDNGFGPAEWATIIAAAIAAVVAVAGYALTQAWARRERHAKTRCTASGCKWRPPPSPRPTKPSYRPPRLKPERRWPMSGTRRR